MLTADEGLRKLDGAAPHLLDEAERQLGFLLPGALRDLYTASDGVYDDAGQWFVIWRIDYLVSHRRNAWDAELAARDDLVAFGDDGTGAPFCLSRRRGDVYFWSPIDGEATWLAADLPSFWQGWTTNSLPLH